MPTCGMNFSTENFDRLPDSAYIRIGTLATLFGCSIATIRRWERKGLLPPAMILPTRRVAWRVGDVRRILRDHHRRRTAS